MNVSIYYRITQYCSQNSSQFYFRDIVEKLDNISCSLTFQVAAVNPAEVELSPTQMLTVSCQVFDCVRVFAAAAVLLAVVCAILV